MGFVKDNYVTSGAFGNLNQLYTKIGKASR
jgi:hypothetical protein